MITPAHDTHNIKNFRICDCCISLQSNFVKKYFSLAIFNSRKSEISFKCLSCPEICFNLKSKCNFELMLPIISWDHILS
jgi:hypothetical protein